MTRDVFFANVDPGGLNTRDEIKILICYLLNTVDTGLSKDDILFVTNYNKIANYFEVNDAIAVLLKDKNINYIEDGDIYVVSDSGKMIAEQLDISLPSTIRTKVVKSAIKLLAKKKRERENHVTIKKTSNGYNVMCTIPDGKIDLMNISLYVPDILQAKEVKSNFHKNPDIIYQSMLACLTGDYDLVSQSLKDIKKIKDISFDDNLGE